MQPDVTVLDPFMGIGSTAYVAMNQSPPTTKLHVGEARNAVGFELKESYFRRAIKNAERACRGGRSNAAVLPLSFTDAEATV